MASKKKKKNGKSTGGWNVNHVLHKVETKGNIGNTMKKSLYEWGFGVIGGCALTALIGKPSFLVGMGATVAGNYFGIPWVAPVGVGMMASSAFLPREKETIKDRIGSLKENFMSNTYLDKVFRKKGTTDSYGNRSYEEGLPDSGVSGVPDTSALDKIEEELYASAMAYQQQTGRRASNGSYAGAGAEETDFSSF